MTVFTTAVRKLQKEIYEIAQQHGWWEGERNDGELIALMHSELSEALEWLRKPTEEVSDRIPDFFALEEELADVVIRILDFAEARGLNVAGAIEAKVTYNANRPYKHGGKKF